MPRTPATEDAETRAIRELDEEDTTAIDGIAARSGPPPDTQRLSQSEQDDLWAFQDRAVASDPDSFARQLLTTGVPPEIVQKLLICQVRPDWAPLYQQPTQDAGKADQLTRMAQYPFRWGMFDDQPDPRARVAKAEHLDRRFQKNQTAVQEQTAQPITLAGPSAPPPMPETGGM